MIIKLFNGKNLLFQLGLMLIFFISMANREIILQEPSGFGPLYNLIYNFLEGNSILIYISFISLILIEGILLQLIVSMYKLVSRNNYIVIFVWLLLIFSNSALASINPVIISTVLITWALFQLFAITENVNPLPNIFTVGFIISFASLIYGNLILYSFFLIIALLILSLFNARTLAVSFLSLSTPYIYYLTYLFVLDQSLDTTKLFLFSFEKWVFFQNGALLWISIGITAVLFIISIISIFNVLTHLNSKLIQTRTAVMVLVAWLIISIILMLVSGAWWFAHPILIFVPMAILISIFLDEQKKTIYYDVAIISLLALEILQLYIS